MKDAETISSAVIMLGRFADLQGLLTGRIREGTFGSHGVVFAVDGPVPRPVPTQPLPAPGGNLAECRPGETETTTLFACYGHPRAWPNCITPWRVNEHFELPPDLQ